MNEKKIARRVAFRFAASSVAEEYRIVQQDIDTVMGDVHKGLDRLHKAHKRKPDDPALLERAKAALAAMRKVYSQTALR